MIDRELLELVAKYWSLEDFILKATQAVEKNKALLTRSIADLDEFVAERNLLEDKILPFLKPGPRYAS